MKNHKTKILIFTCLTLFLTIPTIAERVIIGQQSKSSKAAQQYTENLKEYAKYTHVISGGFSGGNTVFMKIGDTVLFENIKNDISTAGIYVAAIFKNRIILKNFYNTYFAKGASSKMARDIARLPDGTFVVIAVKDEATRNFDKIGQKFLYDIGAETGLLGQEFRTSYLCLGIKGLEKGMAIEKIGMNQLEHKGQHANIQINLIAKENSTVSLSKKPGIHKGLMIGQTEFLYYIPKSFDIKTAEYLFLIHETRNLATQNALNMISQFKMISNIKNIVLVAPAFSCTYSRNVTQKDFKKNGTLKYPNLLNNYYLSEYSFLVNRFNQYRSDSILIEAFDAFNEHLMKRDTFSIYGHFAGGDFVQRFVMYHPEFINKAAAALINSYAFPIYEKEYPYGLNATNLRESFSNQLIQGHGINIPARELDRKLDKMLDIEMHILVNEGNLRIDRREKTAWQGKTHIDKANNYLKELNNTEQRLKKAGIRDKTKKIKTTIHTFHFHRDNQADKAAEEAVKLLFGQGNLAKEEK